MMNFNWSAKVFREYLLRLFVVLCGLLIFNGNVVWAESSLPLRQVEASVGEIIHILQDEHFVGENLRERRKELIFQAINKRFNFRLMARLSLGKMWHNLTVQEQDHFSALFTSLLENTYIRRVEGYAGEKVLYKKDVVKGSRALVYSLFVRNNSELSVIYKLRDEGVKGWMIYDVLLEGASIVKQYRRQFAQVIKHEEISGLLVRLEEKVKIISGP